MRQSVNILKRSEGKLVDAAESWRTKMLQQHADEAKQLLIESRLQQQDDKLFAAVIIDLTDEFGMLFGRETIGDEEVEEIIKVTDPNETPTSLVVLDFDWFLQVSTMAFSKNYIDTITPQGIYVDDYQFPVAAIAAGGITVIEA
jgi:hypothetical protein